MEEEHSRILEEKKADEKKAVLITIVVVLVIALLVLAVILFLPDRKTAPGTSGDQANNIVPGISNSTTASNSNSNFGNNSLSTSSQPVINNNSGIPYENSSVSNSSDTSGSDVLVHKWVINNLGYTYIYGNTGLEQFNDSAETEERYAKTINSLYSSLPKGIKAYSILAPTNVEFVDIPKSIYAADNFFNSSQKKSITGINGKLDTNIKAINIYDTIASHKSEYLYFRTDINWTSLAAYYAYNDFATAAGLAPVKLTDFEKDSYSGFLGRFYSATSEESLSKIPDDVEYFKVDKDNKCKLTAYVKGAVYNGYKIVGNDVSSKANGYNVFLGMEADYYKITTAVQGKGKLLIVSDTSAAAFVPYLVSNYSEIYYVNANSYTGKISKLAADNGITDVLFLNYVTSANRKAYTTMLSQISGAA